MEKTCVIMSDQVVRVHADKILFHSLRQILARFVLEIAGGRPLRPRTVRENIERIPQRELLFLCGSELPDIRSTRPATLLPKAVVCPSGFPSISDFWMAS